MDKLTLVKNNGKKKAPHHDEVINVLISTIDERINDVPAMLLEKQSNVQYIISHQYTDPKFKILPEALNRDDIILSHISSHGLSQNRNNALGLAESGIALVADDDIRYLPGSFEKIRAVFRDNPDTDVACFKVKTCEGEPDYKRYPEEIYSLNFKRRHYISSIEITFRVKTIKNDNIFFDERFGTGSERIPAGEEEAFVQDCLAKKLWVSYYPFYIVQHPYQSSTKHWPIYHKNSIWMTAALDARISIPKAILLALFRTTRHILYLIKNKVNPFYYIFEHFSAILYILNTNKKDN